MQIGTNLLCFKRCLGLTINEIAEIRAVPVQTSNHKSNVNVLFYQPWQVTAKFLIATRSLKLLFENGLLLFNL